MCLQVKKIWTGSPPLSPSRHLFLDCLCNMSELYVLILALLRTEGLRMLRTEAKSRLSSPFPRCRCTLSPSSSTRDWGHGRRSQRPEAPLWCSWQSQCGGDETMVLMQSICLWGKSISEYFLSQTYLTVFLPEGWRQ